MNGKKILYQTIGMGINALSLVSGGAAGKLAFQLFATPPKPNVRTKERRFLQTAQRLDINFRGHNIPVYQWGDNHQPLVFCSYGWGYNAGRWRHYVPNLLEAGYRVIAFDPIGHGLADKGKLNYPLLVTIQRQLLEQTGPPALVLGHSFGGGCLVETLAQLPPDYRPARACYLAIFSEVQWIFLSFKKAIGLNERAFTGMTDYIQTYSGRQLDDFDTARIGSRLTEVPSLLVHDPLDRITAFRNALRNHEHWPGSYLYTPKGAGHHLGTAEVTRKILAWLVEGKIPEGATQNSLPAPPPPSDGVHPEL